MKLTTFGLPTTLLVALVISATTTGFAQRPEHMLDYEQLKARGVVANPYRAGRSVTMSRRGIVATSHNLASQAGLDMLRSGGNAVDAAVAAAATLTIVEPMSTSIGGDVFILYYEATTGKVYGLNGSGHSPRNLPRDHFDKREENSIQPYAWEAVTVSGAFDAYCAILERFGSKPLSEILAPAIHHAEDGFPVTENVAAYWKPSEQRLQNDAAARATYLVDDKAPAMGSIFKNPRLAASFRLLAEGGRDAFYDGPIAQEIVRHASATGGFLEVDDYRRHQSTWVEPIRTSYRGYEVLQCPPNGQGLGVLMMLNILEGFELAKMKRNSPEYLHLQIEAKKLAYADLYKYVADPEHAKIPLKSLLSKEYAAKRRELIDNQHAAADVDPGLPTGHDTVYLTAIDSAGNACSFINSLYHGFGSHIVGGNTGILLQNRGAGFTLESGHFNEYAPDKRPYHTIIPGMVLRDGRLYMSYGLMGGPMQPQGHVQLLLSHLDHRLPIQEAVDAPRWRHVQGKQVMLEYGMPEEAQRGLAAMGHEVRFADGTGFGGSQVILVDPETGTYFGASDPRKDGAALGY
jgi:gamma-glutamyltranspeptidase/glutathione hydrolase